VLLLTVYAAAVPAFNWWCGLLTPVWGVVVAPEWVLVTGTQPVAVVTLAIPDVRHAGFREASLREKAEYAAAQGYWFIACNVTLDAGRPPVWSKLRLIAAVLEQVCRPKGLLPGKRAPPALTRLRPARPARWRGCRARTQLHPPSLPCQVAPTVVWLDLDTIVWTRHVGIDPILALSPGADLHAQHDFHRFSVYFNAGVMIIKQSDWTRWLLDRAYNTRRVMLFRRLVYNMEEQDALNIAAALSMRRPAGTPGRASGYKVRIHAYPRLWSFTHEALEEDGSVAENIFTLHFPNCKDGVCEQAYRRHVDMALAMPTDRPPNADADAARGDSKQGDGENRKTRVFGQDMPLRTSWWSHDR
jgi:hypothetical protein